ncbi:MAG: hypothetical protein B7Y56_13680 [Gallionellales bacterium 35-53-114]|nr:MAG: hypothetical protein B7Y56_13680 [Gallionellales bacterium 35-53-114]OYZ63020.1 MAG: hypothetical protein B7Y04_11135 [Gallionellales bacterium 24-53-125]OZB08998.1 MAG: hypothetical protein B7X61_08465 [Gallionellales bacterium 39-52-133]
MVEGAANKGVEIMVTGVTGCRRDDVNGRVLADDVGIAAIVAIRTGARQDTRMIIPRRYPCAGAMAAIAGRVCNNVSARFTGVALITGSGLHTYMVKARAQKGNRVGVAGFTRLIGNQVVGRFGGCHDATTG